MKKQKIYIVGYTNLSGFNSWSCCAHDVSLEKAKSKLNEILDKMEDFEKMTLGRYVETSYLEEVYE